MEGAALICGLGLEAQVPVTVPVLCGLGLSLDALQAQAQALVQDAVASPPKLDCRRLAKPKRAFRRPGRRRRSVGSGGEEDGFDGSGGGNGGENGRGGWDGWGESWNEEEWWWRWDDARRALFSFFYQVACWVCVMQCLHFMVKNVIRLSQGSMDDATEPTGFAHCSSVFLQLSPKK